MTIHECSRCGLRFCDYITVRAHLSEDHRVHPETLAPQAGLVPA